MVWDLLMSCMESKLSKVKKILVIYIVHINKCIQSVACINKQNFLRDMTQVNIFQGSFRIFMRSYQGVAVEFVN